MNESGAGSDLHQKILTFLGGEFQRKDQRQCVKLELTYSQPNFRDEVIQSWVRADQPDLFENLALVDRLVCEIVEMAEAHADSYGQGKHRFVLRTYQYLGGRATHAFKIEPAYRGNEGEETALATARQGSSESSLIAGHASMLARTNTQMFQGTVGVLAQTNRQLLEENNALRSRMRDIERELDEARTNKLEREFQIEMAMRKSQRTDAGFQKLMQFGTIALAKLTGESAAGGPQSGLAMMLLEFGKSLRPEQISALMNVLDMAQKAMFMEIMSAVTPPDPPPKQSGANP